MRGWAQQEREKAERHGVGHTDARGAGAATAGKSRHGHTLVIMEEAFSRFARLLVLMPGEREEPVRKPTVVFFNPSLPVHDQNLFFCWNFNHRSAPHFFSSSSIRGGG
jgi:hypothetical protein